MEILDVVEKEGACAITFEASDEERNFLLREGVRALVKERGSKVAVVDPSLVDLTDAKMEKYELSDDEAAFLMEKGFNSLLKKYIDEIETKESPSKPA